MTYTKKFTSIHSIFLVGVIGACTPEAQCQDSPEPSLKKTLWFDLGLGVALGERFLASSQGISITYSLGGRLISAQNLLTGEHSQYFSPLSKVEEVSVLYGFFQRDRFTLISGAAGLGLVQGRNDKKFSNDRFLAPGVSFEAQTFLYLNPAVGLGIYSYGTLNRYRSLVGFLFCIQIAQPL